MFVDASSSQFFLGSAARCELVRMWGTDRIMFGSDFPMWDPASEYDTFTSLGFSEASWRTCCGRTPSDSPA